MAWAHAASMDRGNDRCRLGPLFESSPVGEAGILLTEGCFEVHPSCSAKIVSNWFQAVRTLSSPFRASWVRTYSVFRIKQASS